MLAEWDLYDTALAHVQYVQYVRVDVQYVRVGPVGISRKRLLHHLMIYTILLTANIASTCIY